MFWLSGGGLGLLPARLIQSNLIKILFPLFCLVSPVRFEAISVVSHCARSPEPTPSRVEF